MVTAGLSPCQHPDGAARRHGNAVAAVGDRAQPGSVWSDLYPGKTTEIIRDLSMCPGRTECFAATEGPLPVYAGSLPLPVRRWRGVAADAKDASG